jgi:thiamine-monophosphate kinase
MKRGSRRPSGPRSGRSERDIIRGLQQRARLIGDDCAILPGRPDDLLVTTDQFIEDVHFRRATHRPADVGHAALARGLSDIAAMGGHPKQAFVSIALPAWAGPRWLNGFYRGFFALADRFGVELAGGDLSRAAQLYCDVIVLGRVPSGRALRRSGANAGDRIYVSGPLGRPRKRPEPRVDVGLQLRGRATACMDLSDGISLDLARLCEASGVGAELDSVPIARGATLHDALHRGEDYELLFTSPKRLSFLEVGRIVSGKGVRLDGAPLEPRGYDHFASAEWSLTK